MLRYAYMEGFILAAGLGTRLKEYTATRPKALVEVGGITLLERTIQRLEAAGIEHIVINVHHFADMMIDFIDKYRGQTKIDISDERALLLNTGGGLKKASSLFTGRENILVHNVDILSDIDLRDVEAHHRSEGNLVTLCVSKRKSETNRFLKFSPKGLLLERAIKGLCFSGISVVSPTLFPLLPEADHPYEIINEYIRLGHEGHRIGSYLHDGSPKHWIDVGKIETLEQANTQWIASSAE